MTTSMDLQKLSIEFERIADTSSEDGIARLPSPGVEGLQILLASVVDGNPIGVQEVRSGYEAKGWPEDRSFIWSEVESLVEFLVKDTVHAEVEMDNAHAAEVARLCDIIYKRQESKEFPLVRSTDLESEEDQEAAAMSLSLIDKIEHVKLEAYIAEERRKSLDAEFARTGNWPTEQRSDSQNWKLKEAEWNYLNHYAVVRRFLVMETFRNKKFSHRCEGDRFISLIPPQTIKDEGRKQHAHSIFSKVKDGFLPKIDVALWKAWSKIEVILQVTGEDESEVFLRFVNDDYIDIIGKTCDDAAAENGISFSPPYPPEEHASEGETNERLLVLNEATVEQSDTAEAEMTLAYATFRNSRPPSQLKYLPGIPPSKFAVEQYYAFLKKIVHAEIDTKRSTEVPLLGVLGSSAASSGMMNNASGSPPTPTMSPSKRLEIIASPVRRKKQCVDIIEPKVTKVVELQVDSKVGDTCHFNGCLVYCDDRVRNIDAKSPRTGLLDETAVLNLTLADEGGVIQATLWRETARDAFPILEKAMAEVCEHSCAKLTLTYMVVKEPRNPAVQSVRVLHNTEKTELRLEGEHRLLMVPDTRSLITDFRRLKERLPFTAHLKGVVVGEKRERITTKGAEQLCFNLMDRQRRTVACIAHDVSVSLETFKEGTELVIFYASGQEGIRKTPGNVWIYPDSYVLSLGAVVLPGVPSEEVRLMPPL